MLRLQQEENDFDFSINLSLFLISFVISFTFVKQLINNKKDLIITFKIKGF